MGHVFIVVLLAVVFDRFIGDPDGLWRRLPHPVVLFGRLIAWFEQHLNNANFLARKRFYYGWLTIVACLFVSICIAYIIQLLLYPLGWWGSVIEALIGSVFIAQKSLRDHVQAVAIAFDSAGISGARHAVSQIVGRDPQKLDETGVCRAAIESLAENMSDGIVAPVFWFLLLGLPGLFAYKMLNTADSMIGHKNERFSDFGYAAAKLDDFSNYIPARLNALMVLFIVWMRKGRAAFRRGLHILFADASRHRSPNAGWPEAAFAAALEISLAGPRFYGGILTDDSYQNENGAVPTPFDIKRALRLYRWTLDLMTALLAICASAFLI